MSGDIEHLDLASEALNAFSAYAKHMEALPHVNDVLILRMFSDGSGTICASGDRKTVYISFSDLAELVQKIPYD